MIKRLIKKIVTAGLCVAMAMPAIGTMLPEVVPIVYADEAVTVVASGKFNSGGTWSLDSEGVLTLEGKIKCDAYNPSYNSWPWASKAESIKKINSNDVELRGDASYMFYKCYYLEDIDSVSNWDTSRATNMSYMFAHCSSLNDVKAITNWDTSKVIDMSYMFYYCCLHNQYEKHGIEKIDLSGLDTSSVTSVRGMFAENYFLTSVTASDWDMSNVTDMAWMFASCPKLNTIYGTSNWNTDSVTKISHMFEGDSLLLAVDMKEWDVSSVTEMTDIFNGCSQAFSGTFPGGGTWAFNNDTLTISGTINWPATSATEWPWNTYRHKIKKVVIDNQAQIMSGAYMFYNCINLNEIENLKALDISDVTSARYMFYNCMALSDLSEATAFDVSKNVDMTKMFAWCRAASENITSEQLTQEWNIGEKTIIDDMFAGWKSDSAIEVGTLKVDLENKSDFTNVDGIYEITPLYGYKKYLSPTYSVSFSLSGLDTTSYEPGQIVLRIPASPFHSRSGSAEKASVSFSIPRAPSTSDDIPFNYQYDEEGKEYVITNTATIPASGEIAFTFPYASSYYPVNVQNNSKSDDFYAKLEISTASDSTSMISFAPGIYTRTKARFVSNNIWYHSSEVKDGKLYVTYKMFECVSHTQAAFVEHYYSSAEGTISKSYTKADCDSDLDHGSTYLLTVEYPITEEMKDGNKHTVSIDVIAKLTGYDDAKDEWTGRATYDYVYKYNAFAPSTYRNISKQGTGYYAGTINLLRQKQNVGLKYNISASANNYQATVDGDKADPSAYGKKEWTFTIADDVMSFDKINDEKLSLDDYEFYSVGGYISCNDYVEGFNGWYVTSAKSSPTMTLYVKTNNDDDYVRYSEWTSGTTLKLPEGCTGWKIVGSTNLYGITANLTVNVTIKSSEKILSKIENAVSIPIYNTATFEVMNGDAIEWNGSSTGQNTLKDFTASTGIKKDSYVYTNNAKQMFRVTYHSYVVDIWNSDVIDSSVDKNKIQQHVSGTFYDLLPYGTVLDKDSVEAYRAANDRSTYIKYGKSVDFSIETFENYNDTGRTLLVVNVSDEKEPLTQQYYAYRNCYMSGFYIKYTVTYDYATYADLGGRLTNNIIYKTGNDSWDSSSAKPATNWVTDISAIASDVDKNLFISTSDTTNVSIGSAAELSLSKAAKDTDNSSYSQGHDGSIVVSQGESYSYRLRFGSESDTTTSNIVLFDSLENYICEDGTKSGWRGTLQSIDLKQPKLKGIAPVVYYSTVAGLDINKNHNVDDGTVWNKMTDDTDLSAVTAIAIDMRKATDGSDYKLGEKETIRVIVHMKAPEGEDYFVPARAGLRTYNNVYLLNDLTTSTNYQSNHFIHYDYTEVCLLKPAELKITASKNLYDPISSDKKLQDGEFSFNLLDEDNNILQTVENKADGSVTFDVIEYWGEGNHNYKVVEVIPDGAETITDEDGNVAGYVKDGVTYDISEKTLSVTTAEKDGELVVTKE